MTLKHCALIIDHPVFKSIYAIIHYYFCLLSCLRLLSKNIDLHFKESGVYSGLGYGFAGAPGKRHQREALPSQEEAMPKAVAKEVAKNEKVISDMPGVLVKGEDGTLQKLVTPGVEMPLPDFKPEPTRSLFFHIQFKSLS